MRIANAKKRKWVVHFSEEDDNGNDGEEKQSVGMNESHLFSDSERALVPVFSDSERLMKEEEGEEEETDDDEEDEQAAGGFCVEAKECYDDVILPRHHALPDTLDCEPGFLEIIRYMLEKLKENADSQALTPLWRHVCLTMNIDLFTQILVAAVPRALQKFILRPQWDVSELLDLDVVGEKDGTVIVYANLCQKRTLYVLEHECYTGFTEHPPQRMTNHQGCINAAKREIGSKTALHYRYASLEGVEPNFRQLAVFPLETDPIYGQLLEALFMILLNSFQDSYPTRSQFAPDESFRLAVSIREKLQLPLPPWKGLNRVWSLSQFLPFASILNSCSPCLHCGRMTYPASHRTRASGEDILAGFFCCSCSKHMKKKCQLPTKEEIHEKYQQDDLIGRRIAGLKIICDDCGKDESESVRKLVLTKDGMRLLCIQCYKLDRHGKQRTVEDETRVQKRREITLETKCGNPNCNTTQEFLLNYTMSGLQWCEELGDYRCRQCGDLYRRWTKKGRPRERTLAECDKWRQNLEKKGSIERHECENCHQKKGDPGAPTRFNKTDSGYLCMACYVYLHKEKKDRPIESVNYKDAMEKLRLDRQNGVKIVCSVCGREDGTLSRPHALSKKPPYLVHCFQGCLGSSKSKGASSG
jgi:hypothetical protein